MLYFQALINNNGNENLAKIEMQRAQFNALRDRIWLENDAMDGNEAPRDTALEAALKRKEDELEVLYL